MVCRPAASSALLGVLPLGHRTSARAVRKLRSISRSSIWTVLRCVFPKDGSFFWKMPASSAILAFFNRVAGLDYNLASSDNRWNGKAFYHRAFTPEVLDDQFSHGPALTSLLAAASSLLFSCSTTTSWKISISTPAFSGDLRQCPIFFWSIQIITTLSHLESEIALWWPRQHTG